MLKEIYCNMNFIDDVFRHASVRDLGSERYELQGSAILRDKIN